MNCFDRETVVKFIDFREWLVYVFMIAGFLAAGYIYSKSAEVEADRKQWWASVDTHPGFQLRKRKSVPGRFHVSLAGIPQINCNHTVNIGGQPCQAMEAVFHWYDYDLTYAIIWADLPPPLQGTTLRQFALFDNPLPRNILEEYENNEPYSPSECTIAFRKCHTARITLPNKRTVYWKVFFVGSRVYWLTVTGANPLGSQWQVSYFLRSFVPVRNP
jgi:hypothetical protein